MQELIDKILIQLYNDEDNRIDFPILKVQMESMLGITIDSDLKKNVVDLLTSKDLCSRNFFNRDIYLELTPFGKKIIHEYGSYSAYLEAEKKKQAREAEMEILIKRNLELQNEKMEYEKQHRADQNKTFDKETLEFMRIAIDHGKQSIPEDGNLTPKVGAAIVKDGKFLGASFRGQKGKGDHAEYTLFEKILGGADVSGATLYTTLEPCTARGSHKPCAEWIIEKKIRHVYIGILDPNPKIYNNGCKKLKAAGIEVSYFPRTLRNEIASDNDLFIKQYNANPDLSGKATFNYENHNGHFTIGNHEMQFETMWTKADDKSIYVYNDPGTIKTVAIADGNSKITEIKDGSIYDTTSRARTVNKNEIVILENINGYFAAIHIINIMDKSRPNNDRDELTFEYVILPDKTADFTKYKE